MLIFLGFLLALAGFWWRPSRLIDLLLPRFIVPVTLWLVAFYPALSIALFGDESDPMYTQYREEFTVMALAYLLLCFMFWWVGFVLVPKRFGQRSSLLRIVRLQIDNPGRLRFFAVLMVLATTVFLLFSEGPGLLDNSWGEGFLGGDLVLYVTKFAILPINAMGALLFGLSWPLQKEERRFGHYFSGFFVLLLASLSGFCNFSRGSGIYFPLMVLGYIGSSGKLPVKTCIMAILYAAYCGTVALSGRGEFGHFAGAIPFLGHFFSGNISFSDTLYTLTGATDALSPVCVTMHAIAGGTDIGQMSPLDWAIFQIPIPHIAGIGGTYTLDLTLLLGGTGAWGYTSTMFGDTFAHFGWLGSLWFIYMGMLYRFLENMVISSNDGEGGINLVWLMLPLAYFAFLNGNFNTYRSWNSTFTFGLGAVLVGCWFWKLIAQRNNDVQVLDIQEDELPPEAFETHLN